ncbi:MAG: glycosyltransferase [Pseudomonadota bacterium]
MTHRIVFLIDSFTGPWAGTERQLWHLMQGLDRQRFAPHLVLLRHSDYSLQARDWPCPVDVIGIERLASPAGLWGLLRLARLLRRLDARVVHAFFQDASLLGPVAARLAGARFVAGRRDMGIWYNPANLRLLRLSSRLVDGVIANSKAVQALVAREEHIAASRISVIRNGLEPPASPGVVDLPGDIPAGAPVIGIVANLRPVKRHADLIRAFAGVRRTLPDAHLVIVGEGGLEGELRQLAAAEGVGSNTHFLGRIEEPVGVIRRFTVAALCSESEGLSNALMECLREGKPAVCTDVGGNPELVTAGSNGFLYPVGNVDDLTRHLLRLLTDPGLLREMSAAAVRSVAAMTIENMVEKHMLSYETLLQAASRQGGLIEEDGGRQVGAGCTKGKEHT